MSNPLIKEMASCLNDTLVKSLNTVVENISKAVNEIQTSFTKHCKSLEDNLLSNKAKPSHITDSPMPTKSVASLQASLFSEQKEREKQELNVVLHNLPESTAAVSTTRKTDDIAKVTSMLNEFINVKPTISNAIRLGKKGSDKPHLLKITVGSTEEKIAILHNKLRLRMESNPDNERKIFIIPDYTPLEQKKNNALRQ